MVAEDGSFCPVSLTTLTEPTLAVRAGSLEKVTGLGMWIWGGRVVEGRQETSPYLGETGDERTKGDRSFDFQVEELGFCLGCGRELHMDPGRSVYDVVFPTGSRACLQGWVHA